LIRNENTKTVTLPSLFLHHLIIIEQKTVTNISFAKSVQKERGHNSITVIPEFPDKKDV